jgi:hypothetical protein
MAGLILPGALLCLTGIGAIIGVPMIVIGLFGPIVGPLMGLTSMTGPCPWCGTQALSPPGTRLGFDCPACKRRIVLQGTRFVGIE